MNPFDSSSNSIIIAFLFPSEQEKKKLLRIPIILLPCLHHHCLNLYHYLKPFIISLLQQQITVLPNAKCFILLILWKVQWKHQTHLIALLNSEPPHLNKYQFLKTWETNCTQKKSHLQNEKFKVKNFSKLSKILLQTMESSWVCNMDASEDG